MLEKIIQKLLCMKMCVTVGKWKRVSVASGYEELWREGKWNGGHTMWMESSLQISAPQSQDSVPLGWRPLFAVLKTTPDTLDAQSASGSAVLQAKKSELHPISDKKPSEGADFKHL